MIPIGTALVRNQPDLAELFEYVNKLVAEIDSNPERGTRFHLGLSVLESNSVITQLHLKDIDFIIFLKLIFRHLTCCRTTGTTAIKAIINTNETEH